MYRGFPGEPEGYVQPADEGWTTVGPSAVAYPGAPCASCVDHRGDRGVVQVTPPMAICCTSSSRWCRIRAPTATGVISPGGPGYQVPFARSVPGGRSQDRRGGMLVGPRQAEEILRRGDATWSSSPRRRCGSRTGRCESRKLGMKWHEAGYRPTYTPAAHGLRARTGLTHPRFIRVTGDAIDPTFSGSR
jgi:hypothetical protein